ncbi:MAG: SIMPL domain-containing protein [Clostridia bacterium]|nr:SIMPL domain-containing protein [Clostridia bacterium]
MRRITGYIAVLVMACLLALCLTGCTGRTVMTGKDEMTQTVTVSASGTVQLTPDMATVTFGVTTRENTAQEAQDKNSRTVQQVTDVLKEKGVAEESIRTSYYNMYPQYEYYADGERVLTGYAVSTTLTVSDQKIENVGKLLGDCVAAGVNSIDSVTFLCSGYDEAYEQALAQAMDAAHVKAQALAKAAGKTLDGAAQITEGWQDMSAKYRNDTTQYSIEADAVEAAGAAAFLPGETQITANVTVTYGMR